MLNDNLGNYKRRYINDVYPIVTDANGYCAINFDISGHGFTDRPFMVNISNAYYGDLLSFNYNFDLATNASLPVVFKFAQLSSNFNTRLVIELIGV